MGEIQKNKQKYQMNILTQQKKNMANNIREKYIGNNLKPNSFWSHPPKTTWRIIGEQEME